MFKSLFNQLVDLTFSPNERRFYPQVYALFIVSLRSYIFFEFISYLSLIVVFYGVIDLWVYALVMVIGLVTSRYEIVFGERALEQPNRFEHPTTRNLNHCFHLFIWMFRSARLGFLALLLLQSGTDQYLLLTTMFFCISAIMIAISSFFYRASITLLVTYLGFYIWALLNYAQHPLGDSFWILFGMSCALVLFGGVQRGKLSRIILSSARNEKLVTAFQSSIDELNQFYFQQSRYLSAASHDLRQPLHALALTVNGALRQAQHPSNVFALNRVEHSIEQLSDSFNAMLQLSRFDAESVLPKHQWVSLNDVFNRLMQEFAPTATTSGIVLKSRKSDDCVRTDPLVLHTILKNLLHYLLHLQGTQKILLATRKQANSLSILLHWQTTHSNHATYSERLDFENQEQLSLNIALAKRFCNIMQHPFLPVKTQGNILRMGMAINDASLNVMRVPVISHSESTVSEKVELDLNVIESHVPPNDFLSAPLALQGKRAIVIDDDPVIADGLEQLLGSWGIEVTIALSSEMVHEVIEEEGPVDWLISDFHLGEIGETGLDIIQKFKQAQPDAQTRFVLISGDTTQELTTQSQSIVDLLVYKPIKPAKLRVQLSGLSSQS